MFIGVGKKFGKDECLKLLLRMSGVITAGYTCPVFDSLLHVDVAILVDVWPTRHAILLAPGSPRITCSFHATLFRSFTCSLYLPVVPLTRKSEFSKFLLTLSPYGGAVAMLFSNQSCYSALPVVQRCWKTRDIPVLFSTTFWMLALLPSTQRVVNPSHRRSRLLQKRITLLAALLPCGSTRRLYVY